MKLLPIGSFATNIESVKDIFVVSLGILSGINQKAADSQRAKKITKSIEDNKELSSLEKHQLIRVTASIVADLNKHVPPFCYFGHHPTDYTHLGVWIDLNALHKAEISGKLTQVSGDSWKGIKSMYVLDMGKEGLTLYKRRGKKAIWTMT